MAKAQYPPREFRHGQGIARNLGCFAQAVSREPEQRVPPPGLLGAADPLRVQHEHPPELGAQARSFTGSQAGVITTGTHGNAKIIDVTPGRISEALAAGLPVAGRTGTLATELRGSPAVGLRLKRPTPSSGMIAFTSGCILNASAADGRRVVWAQVRDAGGTLIAINQSTRFPIEFGFAKTADAETPTGITAQRPLRFFAYGIGEAVVAPGGAPLPSFHSEMMQRLGVWGFRLAAERDVVRGALLALVLEVVGDLAAAQHDAQHLRGLERLRVVRGRLLEHAAGARMLAAGGVAVVACEV